jgi:hypothetical protein
MEEQQEYKQLIPKTEFPELVGKLTYCEGNRCWNTIRLRKEIMGLFPQLREKRSSFGYKMKICLNYGDLLKTIRLMEKRKEAIPILLTFHRTNENQISA